MITFNFWVWWLPIFLFYLMTQGIVLLTAAITSFFDGPEPKWLSDTIDFFVKMNVPMLAINFLGTAAFALELFIRG